ncbi:MAG: hypothetical protein IT289_05265 [Oligoflexia bacterium]|nr:hypothetical protein [Oligoflexia bacterium]
MKIILTIALIAIASLGGVAEGSRAATKKPCVYTDFSYIFDSLLRLEVRRGQELLEEVKALLAEEMGPLCERVSLAAGPGIPGRKAQIFQLSGSGDRDYTLTFVSDFESSSEFATIEKGLLY